MSTYTLRSATPEDAAGISGVLMAIVAAGKRTKAADEAFVLTHYVEDPERLQCTVAVEADGTVLGFQSLKCATPGNVYGTPVGWGIIGTHIHPGAARRGVGKALWTESLRVAGEAGLASIEALIGAGNLEGIGYYEAMGFRTYRLEPGAVGKRFDLVSPGQAG
ncbi:GNAT family N-acetyltransferase [Aliiroseovarius sp.]|uniref:GNAT family N-acetyltransferase n=1 Tax=Aliiroseovarius sp. TaxID=1872442 RepID=UPI003BA8F207